MNPKKHAESLSVREKRALIKEFREDFTEKQWLKMLDIAPVAGNVATKAAKQESKSKDTLAGLKPEQHKQVKATIAALAEKFERQPEDFGVVIVESETGEKKTVVMLTSGNGLYKGSWNSIMSNKNADVFMVEVSGRQIDTRPAMIEDVYKAFIADEKAKGTYPLPDSPQLASQNDQPWTETWLTGEPPDVLNAFSGYVSLDGRPYRDWNSRDNDNDNLRVRPAVGKLMQAFQPAAGHPANIG